MNKFEYLGETFLGIRTLKDQNERDKVFFGRKTIYREQEGYSYSEFYSKAESAGCGNYEIFEKQRGGSKDYVVPGERGFFVLESGFNI